MEDLKKEESMPVIYKHVVKWNVTIGKKEFELTDNQLQILKDMSIAGKSSIVWFDGFAISIPHITCIEKVCDKYGKGTFKSPYLDEKNEVEKKYVWEFIDKEEYELANKDSLILDEKAKNSISKFTNYVKGMDFVTKNKGDNQHRLESLELSNL